MPDKLTLNVGTDQLIHRIPAGVMPNDYSTELFGCRTTGKVFAFSGGNTIPFHELCPSKISQIEERLLADPIALESLKHMSWDDAVEKYSFCIFGSADSEADICLNGELKEADNFICSGNCMCLKWASKKITVDGQQLTVRQLEIAQLLATDKTDKEIADDLGISVSTLDTHKKQLFEKCNVVSKTSLVVKLINQKIIQ